MKTKRRIITAVCVCGLSAHAQLSGEDDYYLSFPKGEEREARIREDILTGKLRVPFPVAQGGGHIAIVLDDWVHRPREEMDEAVNALTVQDVPVFAHILRFHEWLLETLEATPSFPTSKFEMMMVHVVRLDGYDIRSAGNPSILDYTRKYFREFEKNKGLSGRYVYAVSYLALKGKADDCAMLEKALPMVYGADNKSHFAHCLDVLNARASGTNLLEGLDGKDYHGWSTNSPAFLPSVANTGPQAAYVYDLLKQALTKYGSTSNIPPELITMMVTFDADGQPVCNVDLPRYGLVMPDIAPPVADDYVLLDSATKEQQPSNEFAETKSTLWKTPLLLSFIVIGGVIMAWLRRRGKR